LNFFVNSFYLSSRVRRNKRASAHQSTIASSYDNENSDEIDIDGEDHDNVDDTDEEDSPDEDDEYQRRPRKARRAKTNKRRKR